MRKLLTSTAAVAALGVPAATLPAANASAATIQPATVQVAMQALRGGTPNSLPSKDPCSGTVTKFGADMVVCVDDEGNSTYNVRASFTNNTTSDVTVDFFLFFSPGRQPLGSCTSQVVSPGAERNCTLASGIFHALPVDGEATFIWDNGQIQWTVDSPEITS
jgi:hypothetical protein